MTKITPGNGLMLYFRTNNLEHRNAQRAILLTLSAKHITYCQPNLVEIA